MRCRVGGGVLRGEARYLCEVNQIRFVGPVDGVHSVVDSGVKDGEAARGVNSSGLRARSANNRQKCSVPLHDWIDCLGRGIGCALMLVVKRSGIRAASHYGKTCTE